MNIYIYIHKPQNLKSDFVSFLKISYRYCTLWKKQKSSVATRNFYKFLHLCKDLVKGFTLKIINQNSKK